MVKSTRGGPDGSAGRSKRRVDCKSWSNARDSLLMGLCVADPTAISIIRDGTVDIEVATSRSDPRARSCQLHPKAVGACHELINHHSPPIEEAVDSKVHE